MPALQSLYLHDCRRVTMEALIACLWYKRLPSLIQLEAIWPLEHLKTGEYQILVKACAGESTNVCFVALLSNYATDRNIQMTSAMSAHYAPLVSSGLRDFVSRLTELPVSSRDRIQTASERDTRQRRSRHCEEVRRSFSVHRGYPYASHV